MKIRIKFAKQGYMKFVGHLDTMRYFQKAMRRAGVDIVYSEGFSPHQKMSFAAPLGVGLTSRGEYMDIEVRSTENSVSMIKRLNEQMVEGMEVLSYRLLDDESQNAMSVVAAADYSVKFREGYEPDINIKDKFTEFLSCQSLCVTKKTKKGERDIDIRPGIFDADVRDDEIFLKLASSSAFYLKPELVMKGFYDYLGICMPEFALCIERLEVYAGNERDGFVPLEEYGDIIENDLQ